uniref:Uncharacterized protein n=1 Tax=Oryza nivara TaxID=4536 RepID=A0A0E0H7W0_ORYNI
MEKLVSRWQIQRRIRQRGKSRVTGDSEGLDPAMGSEGQGRSWWRRWIRWRGGAWGWIEGCAR